MADKEFLLGNKAMDLLVYTNTSTRVVSGDVSTKDVRAIVKSIAELDNIRDVDLVCSNVLKVLDSKGKDGFTKSKYRLYGEDMRKVAKQIVLDIEAANCKDFSTQYDERLELIVCVLSNCSLLIRYIQTCVNDGVVSVKKAGVWTSKVMEVKRMAAAWKKGDGSRARKLREDAKLAEEQRLYNLLRSAFSDALSHK
jgi:hypothetical protein